ncbi:MAG: ATP-binding cassette domain-containing protein, partial [Dehalococcoidia bacterium]
MVSEAEARERIRTGGDNVLVDIRDLKVYFPITAGIIFQRKIADVKAVDGISFAIRRGETLGLVGESGCGKSTTGRAILQLYRPTAGQILFGGTELTTLKGGALRAMRRKMQMIFQDPYASLNPRMSVGSIIGEPLAIHGLAKGKARRERIHEIMRIVGLNPFYANRYPHEFSGGQRQRIGVARALAVEPDFIVA